MYVLVLRMVAGPPELSSLCNTGLLHFFKPHPYLSSARVPGRNSYHLGLPRAWQNWHVLMNNVESRLFHNHSETLNTSQGEIPSITLNHLKLSIEKDHSVLPCKGAPSNIGFKFHSTASFLIIYSLPTAYKLQSCKDCLETILITYNAQRSLNKIFIFLKVVFNTQPFFNKLWSLSTYRLVKFSNSINKNPHSTSPS